MTPPFPLPVLFTSWTWKDGAGIAGEVIRRAKLGGFKTVAVQLSQDTGGDPGSTLDAQDVRYLKDAGLFVVGWDVAAPDHAQKCAELGLDGWLPQVEGPGQRDALLAVLKSGAPKLPRALVTTYGGLDTLADEGELQVAWGGVPFTFVECYKADGYPHNDISRMLSQGVVYGFPADALRALVGTYRGELVTDYPGLTSANYGGAYLEESMTDAQLASFNFGDSPPPPPPPEPTVTNDAAARNAKIAGIAEEWLAEFGPAPRTRLANIANIAGSDDDHWNAVRDDVVLALNGDVADLRAERDRLQSALDAAAQHAANLNAKIAAAKTALG